MKETMNKLWTTIRQAVACAIAFVSAVFGILAYIFMLVGMIFAKIGQFPHYVSATAMRIADKVAFGSANRLVIGKFARRAEN